MALLDLKRFRAQFPEFEGASDVVVSYVLDQAGRRTPAGIWGDLQEEGHGLLTAHMLCLRPEGKDMRLEGSGFERSLYGRERMHLNRVVSSGFRVTGSD
jgi:hypothetical protein